MAENEAEQPVKEGKPEVADSTSSVDIKGYELEPIPLARPAATPSPTPAPKAISEDTNIASRKVGDSSLLEGFDVEADFDRDPEVQQALKPAASGRIEPRTESNKPPVAPIGPEQEADRGGPFAKPGMGDFKALGIAAAILTLIAAIASAVTTKDNRIGAAIAAVYLTLLHSATGLGAVAAAAFLLERRLGSLELAAARMGLAVAVFQLLIHVNLGFSHRSIEAAMACIGYLGVIWAFFRVKPSTVMLIAGVHAALWLSIEIGYWVISWANTPAARATSAVMPGGGP